LISRDADGFTLPPQMGFRLGPRTLYTRYLLQIHYLRPVEPLPPGPPLFDTSGLRLWFTPDLRPVGFLVLFCIARCSFLLLCITVAVQSSTAARSFYWTTRWRFLPIQRPIIWLSPVTGRTWPVCSGIPRKPTSWLTSDVEMLAADLVGGRELTFFATHLHAHNYGSALWVEHLRNGKVLGTLGRNLNYSGYGPSQNYEFYTAASRFRAGDELRAHCVFNTTGVTSETHYGVDHGDEMCAFLLFYYPSNSSALAPQSHICSLLPIPG
jgi:hypothetical protein